MNSIAKTCAVLWLVASATTSAVAQQASHIVIKFSHVVTVDTPKGKAAQRFKELAEERSKGRIKVEIFPNSSLYKDKEELEALQLGAVQMLAPSLSKFGPLGVRQFEIFDLPYLFPDDPAFQRVTQGATGKQLFALLEPRQIKGLAYWSGGFHVMSANKPLRTPSDVKGLKMRIPSSKVLEANERALGAIPQIMAFSEVYQALQTGVVDGTENILSSYTTQKYIEVQKNITLTYHTHTGYAVVMNKAFWEGLAPDLQAVVASSIKDATDYEQKLVTEENDAALAQIRATDKVQVLALTDAQRADWKKAMWPVHKEMEPRIGAALLNEVYQIAGSHPP
ncbi:MAG: DctP family TRAP transporter solute-binding subunit [Burkholderiaceae bacterium]